MLQPKRFAKEIGGRQLIIETQHLANQADGAVTVRYGDTVILATVVMSDEAREGVDYLPLMVDYDERLYAAGKIKGSRFIKREGRPSDEAVLSGRMIDRSIRPFFNEQIRHDIQVIITTFSFDQENDPDIPALVGASAALAISSVPWAGPVAGVRVGRINNEWVLNPTYKAREKSEFDLVVVGTAERIVMIEALAKETPEDVIQGAIEFAHRHIRKTLRLIEDLTTALKPKKRQLLPELDESDQRQLKALRSKVGEVLEKKLTHLPIIKYKSELEKLVNDLTLELDEMLKADSTVSKEERQKALTMVKEWLGEKMRDQVLKESKRLDGRGLTEIRPLHIETAVLPRTHGSALFERGETQILSTVTLGSPSEEQLIETVEETGKRRYFHHYNFPGFSVGEVKPLRGPGRREIGHGALAEKAILPLLPAKDDFPYTIRVVSEVLSSNGSTSMASVCGSSLALMDAGVPISAQAAGISIGLVTDSKSANYRLLTDIQGLEDAYGDMDFKVAGTAAGITAIQLDVKINGLTYEMIKNILEQARQARLYILTEMNKVIDQPRSSLSPYAPRIYTIKINPERIRDVIGPQGKVINEIIDETGVTIDIEDDGQILVTSTDAQAAEKALAWIKNITREIKVGEVFNGKVTRIMDFGAFVEILPRHEGLIHISELAPFRVRTVQDVVKIGDIIPVKVIKIDEEGRINLSLKKTGYKYPSNLVRKFTPSRSHRPKPPQGQHKA